MERYVIHVTKNCNLACKYCYEDDKSSGDRTWEQTKPLLNDIVKNKEPFEVEFLGGEPLLNFKLIKQCVEYLNKNATVKNYYITTNGTILNKDILEFLRNNPNIRVGVSMDGTRFANSLRVFKDGDQKNSFEVALKNLHILKDCIGNDRLFIHTLIHPYNVGYFSDSVDFLYKEGFRNIDPGIIEKTMPITDEYKKTFVREFGIVGHRIIAGEYPGLRVTIFNCLPERSNKVYVKDERGVIVGEAYGRSDTEFNGYTIIEPYSHNDVVFNLRNIVYQNYLKEVKNDEDVYCR